MLPTKKSSVLSMLMLLIYREEQLMNRTKWMTCFLVSTINDLHQSVGQSKKEYLSLMNLVVIIYS